VASREVITKALGTFVLAGMGGDVSGERVSVYALALDDVTDAQVMEATVRLLKSHEGGFIPTPALIREAAGANTPPVIDAERLLRGIDRLGSYNPNTGWTSPRVEVVREVMGDSVADAYAIAGGPSRLFADNQTTRDISAREFAQEMAAQVREHGPSALPAAMRGPKLIRGAA
jgi:hypothetical protein